MTVRIVHKGKGKGLDVDAAAALGFRVVLRAKCGFGEPADGERPHWYRNRNNRFGYDRYEHTRLFGTHDPGDRAEVAGGAVRSQIEHSIVVARLDDIAACSAAFQQFARRYNVRLEKG